MRGTSHPCRGTGSRDARRAWTRRCSSRIRPVRRWRRSCRRRVVNRAGGDLLENLEETWKAHLDRIGATELDAFARGHARDRAEHREPMVARLDDTAAESGGNPSNAEAVAGCPDEAPILRSSSTTPAIRSVSLTRSSARARRSLRARDRRRARGAAARRSATAPRRARQSRPRARTHASPRPPPAHRRAAGDCRPRSGRPCARGRREPVRRGLSPTCIVSVDPGTIAAATSRGAADESRPGLELVEPERVGGLHRGTARAARHPCSARSRSRSVWSRVGIGSTTVVVPAAKRPASSTADFTCAEGTGSS